MIRELKWHIYNEENNPLCWDDKMLEFDTEESANRFLYSCIDEIYEDFEEYCKTYGVSIRQTIAFYDGGYLDATNLIVEHTDEDEHLINVKE